MSIKENEIKKKDSKIDEKEETSTNEDTNVVEKDKYEEFNYELNRSLRKSVDKGKTTRKVKGANEEVLFYAELEDWQEFALHLKAEYNKRVLENMSKDFESKPSQTAALDNSYSHIIRNARNYDLLTVPEEVLFLRLYHELGDKEAFDILVNANVLIAISVVKDRKFYSDVLTDSDFVQEGILGVQKGIERFDLSRGFRLSTFMVINIHQTVSSAVKNLGDTIRIPISVHSQKSRLRRAEDFLNWEHGYGNWDDDDLLERVNEGKEDKPTQIIKPHHLKVIRELTNPALSLDLMYEENEKDPNSFSLQDILADEDGLTPAEEFRENELYYNLVKFLETHLEPQEQEMVEIIYGIDRPQAFRQISKAAKEMGLPLNKAKKIRDSAMKKLKENAVGGGLEIFLND